MFVSPIHIRFQPFTSEDLQDRLDTVINEFEARIDGWYLEIADRCINGWQVNGKDCISTIDRFRYEAHHIPDSAFAVIMIVLNYFEVIGVYKRGVLNTKHNKAFKQGVIDVFSQLDAEEAKKLASRMYGVRTYLYHVTPSPKSFILRHDPTAPPVMFDERDVLVIDPHTLVPSLRRHFKEYCEQLRDQSQTELRHTFQRAFAFIYQLDEPQPNF